MIVLVGQDWMLNSSADKPRQDTDWVQQEVGIALLHQVRMIPLLVGIDHPLRNPLCLRLFDRSRNAITDGFGRTTQWTGTLIWPRSAGV